MIKLIPTDVKLLELLKVKEDGDDEDGFTVNHNPVLVPPKDVCQKGIKAIIKFYQEDM